MTYVSKSRQISGRNLAKRYFFFVVGVLINSFGIAFITKAALGTSPISSVPYVLSLQFAPSLGAFTFVLNLGFILLQAALLGREFPKIQFLQIAVNVVFSAFIDVSMSLLAWLSPGSYPMKLLSLLFGCAILAFGIYVEVSAGVLMVPGEGAVTALSRSLKKEFGTVKVCFDVMLMATAVLLSLLFFHGLQGIREGTVISALLVGFLTKCFHRIFPGIPRFLAPAV